MAAINVQFADNTKTTVTGYAGCAQDPATWPNQGAIDTSDARWSAYYWALPSSVQAGLPAASPQTATQLLAKAQAAQIAVLSAAYFAATQQPISFTSNGGVTKTYQADAGSVSNLLQMLAAFQLAGATPAGFYWVSLDNTQVPFIFADMQGLAQVMGMQGATAFQKLQTLKAQVLAATTPSEALGVS